MTGDKMIRTIYQFYCYKCYKPNISEKSFNLDLEDNRLIRIFCPNCKAWVFCDETNLSPYRYKIIKKKEWSIVDEDTSINTTIYKNNNYEDIVKICEQLNRNIISTSTIDHINNHHNILKTIDWYFNTFQH